MPRTGFFISNKKACRTAQLQVLQLLKRPLKCDMKNDPLIPHTHTLFSSLLFRIQTWQAGRILLAQNMRTTHYKHTALVAIINSYHATPLHDALRETTDKNTSPTRTRYDLNKRQLAQKQPHSNVGDVWCRVPCELRPCVLSHWGVSPAQS